MGQPAEKILNIGRATVAELEAVSPNVVAELIGWVLADVHGGDVFL
jgi:hypothetical protein